MHAGFALVVAATLPGPLAAQDEVPRAEHPRPDFRRERWLTLNGGWLFRADPDDHGVEDGWHSQYDVDEHDAITVPFPWESIASGLRIDSREIGWYRRLFAVPPEWRDQRVTVTFGAIAGAARVWLNGSELGRHDDEFVPLELDLTSTLLRERQNDLVVRVEPRRFDADSELDRTPRHTTATGIWQSVWLEARPATWITGLRVVPRIAPDETTSRATIFVDVASVSPVKEARVTIEVPDGGGTQAERVDVEATPARARFEVTIPDAVLWRPGRPHLYEATVAVEVDGARDEVATLFGLRDVTSGRPDGADGSLVLLNGEPLFIAGVLHSGRHPESLTTYPSDEAIRRDIELALASGFNAIRVEGKLEDPRFYFWCDRLGCLVLQDIPAVPSDSSNARDRWEARFDAVLRRDANHPSIIAWTLFDATIRDAADRDGPPAHEWMRAMVQRARDADPTRLVDDLAARNRDHVDTDIGSWQLLADTIHDHERLRRAVDLEVERHVPGSTFNFVEGGSVDGQPLLNVGLGFAPLARGDQDVALAYHFLRSTLRCHGEIAGFVWCRLTDMEWDHRGLFNYDRSPKTFGSAELVPDSDPSDLNRADAVVFDAPPVQESTPGASLDVPVVLSHFSSLDVPDGELELAVTLEATGRLGEPVSSALGVFPARWAPARATRQEGVVVTLPDATASGALVATLRRRDTSESICRGFVPLLVRAGKAPRVEVLEGGRRIVLRFAPGDTSRATVVPLRDRHPGLLRAPGRPRLVYRLELPELVAPSNVTGLTFLAELAAFGDASRRDWTRHDADNDHPQTDARTTPASIELGIASLPVRTIHLLDAPSDIRGVVSYATGLPNGLWGALVTERFDDVDLDARVLELALEATTDTGLTILGETAGRYVVDPTLVLDLASPVTPSGSLEELTAARDRVGESATVLLPTLAEGGAAWRYALRRQVGDWVGARFDDGRWQSATEPPARWPTGAIWLRARFEASARDVDGVVLLTLRHTADIAVWLNGRRVLRARGAAGGYDTVPLADDEEPLLVEGENVLAVYASGAHEALSVDIGVKVERQGPAREE